MIVTIVSRILPNRFKKLLHRPLPHQGSTRLPPAINLILFPRTGVLFMAVSLKRTFDLARMAGDAWKLRRATDRSVAQQARRTLVARMGRLRGIPQKIGQILSMSSTESSAEFLPLTDQVSPLPFSTIRHCLTLAWERPIANVVSKIHDPGLAASLGQVHRATLWDGTEVAIKVRYPGIEKAVESDLKVLGWLTFPSPTKTRGFDKSAYHEEMMRNISEELDYAMEAEHQQLFRLRAQKIPGLVIPRVMNEWSRESVLMTTWEEGDTIEQVMASWSCDEKESLARQIFQTFCTLLFDHGLLQADPHSGNFRFRRSAKLNQIVMYDFGSVITLTDNERLALMGLIQATMNRRAVDPFPYFVAMGFDPSMLEPVREKLPALSSVLFEPFVTDAPYDWSTWNRGNRVSGILGEDRWNFRMSGPARLIFLMRALHGLVYYVEKLGQPINGARILRPILEKHAAALGKLPLPETSTPVATFAGLARFLRIEIKEGGETRVAVKLPAMAVEDLETYLDLEVMNKIYRRGIDLSEIIHRVRQSGYAPGELFDLEDGSKRFSVCLEG